MITATTMLYLYVETPLHAGMGAGLSSIDLPIQRERTTQYPMISGQQHQRETPFISRREQPGRRTHSRNIWSAPYGWRNER